MSSESRSKETVQELVTPARTSWTDSPFARTMLVTMVFLIALAVNFYPILRSPVRIRHGYGYFGDSYLYLKLAYNLYEGHGFSGTDDGGALGLPHPERPPTYEPSVTRGPVYPVFLCVVYKVFGSREAMASRDTWHVNWDRVRVVQCVLNAVTCLLVFWIARVIRPESFWAALTAALIYAFCFYNVFYTRALLSESVTTFILTGFVLLGVLALKTNRVSWWLASGALFGVTMLSRAEYILFPLVFGGYIVWVYRDRGWLGIRNAILFVVAALCIVAPWTIRNYCASRRLVPVSVGVLGPCLYGGTFESEKNWKGWGVYSDEVFYLPQEKERFNALYASYDQDLMKGSMNVRDDDAAFTQLALERIRSRPLECLANWFAKAPRLWYQNYIPMYEEREAAGYWFIFYFVFALLAFGLNGNQERVLMGLVGLLFIYLNLIFLPLHIEPRFGVALMPGIIALTGIGLCKTFVWMKTKLNV